MKNIYYIIIALILAIFIDYGLSKTRIPVNEKGYLIGFEKVVQMAERTKDDPRIVLIGGSSLGWGVSAKRLTQELGVPTINAGIHAGLGFRGFYEIMKEMLNPKHDILVISPEFSIPSDSNSNLRTNEFCEISLSVLNRYPAQCVGFTLAKVARVIPVIDRPNGDYFRAGFNDFGDYVYREEGATMKGKVDLNSTCSGINLDDLKNQYIPYYKALEKKGFRVFYLPNFIPESACTDHQLLNEFHLTLFNEFGIQGFEKQEILYGDEYFFNSNYHPTKEGVAIKTQTYIEQLKTILTEVR